MRWDRESWVKLYRHVPSSWLLLSVSARGLGSEILKYANEMGEISIGNDAPAVALATILGARRRERKRIAEDVEELLADGYLVHTPGRLTIKNFVEAQDRTPGAKRTERWRERRGAGAEEGVTRDAPGDVRGRARVTSRVTSQVTPATVTGDVTGDGPSVTGDVTCAAPCDVDPIRSDPIRERSVTEPSSSPQTGGRSHGRAQVARPEPAEEVIAPAPASAPGVGSSEGSGDFDFEALAEAQRRALERLRAIEARAKTPETPPSKPATDPPKPGVPSGEPELPAPPLAGSGPDAPKGKPEALATDGPNPAIEAVREALRGSTATRHLATKDDFVARLTQHTREHGFTGQASTAQVCASVKAAQEKLEAEAAAGEYHGAREVVGMLVGYVKRAHEPPRRWGGREPPVGHDKPLHIPPPAPMKPDWSTDFWQEEFAREDAERAEREAQEEG